MHELAITQSVLDIAVGQARQHGAWRITAVNLVVGELTGYVPDSIQFYFDLLSRGTLAEAAALNVRRVPTRVRCRQCQAEFQPEEGVLWVCSACGSLGGDLLSGNELLVESIEVE